MSTNVKSPMAGTIWKLLVKVGDKVNVGDTIAVLESMKMEIPIEAELSGVVEEINAPEGSVVDEGEEIITFA